MNKLNPKAKEIFLKAKAYAENFRPIVGEKGFFAWDINETITLYRTACSAGIITPQEFWERTQQLVRFAIARYHSWEEYAVSLLCGATYFMFRQDKMQETMLENFLNININMVQFLFGPQDVYKRQGLDRLILNLVLPLKPGKHWKPLWKPQKWNISTW